MPLLLIVLKTRCSPVRSQTIHNGNQTAYLTFGIYMEYSSWKIIEKNFPVTLSSKPMSAITVLTTNFAHAPLKNY